MDESGVKTWDFDFTLADLFLDTYLVLSTSILSDHDSAFCVCARLQPAAKAVWGGRSATIALLFQPISIPI
jgi:hypothetical protein